MIGSEPRANGSSAPSRCLAVCMAHPDDEAYTAYGTVALHADDPSFRLVVLHATDGEAGEIARGVAATRQTLGAIRRLEDESGWEAVGRRPERHDWLGYPDGKVDAVPFEDLVRRIADFLDAERPDVVMSFGPDGVTGHPDHITVGRATDEAFHRVRVDGGAGLRRLLHCAIRSSLFERHQQWLAANDKPVWDPTKMYHLRGIPDEHISVHVDARAVADKVVAGLKEHRSQRHVIYDPDGADELWLKYATRQFHVIAWPPQAPVGHRLTDVFQDLELA
jgi:LmbE family N-acetylglucosaminyl deacetylase